MRAARLCDFCLDENADPDYEEVIGFARRRHQGGQNHVVARKATGRYIGPDCLRKLQRGELAGQELLALPGVAS